VTEQQWTQVKSIVAAALEVPSAKRGDWLTRKPIADAEVEIEVLRLLDNDLGADNILESLFQRSAADNTPHQPLLTPGRILNQRFEVQSIVGFGGMGEVYLANDLDVREQLAIKTLRPEFSDLPSLVARLKKEVHIARRIRHPNVCRIYDVHRADYDGRDIFFLAMEFLRGETLRKHLSREKCPLPVAFRIIEQVSLGLQAAHEAGILHRDLKSENVILVNQLDGPPRAVITDFGLSREMRPTAETQSLFGPNAIVGTPAYMAPEQLRGEGVSIASDVYSLGVVAFELMTGRLPFEGETALAIALKRMQESAPSPREFRPDIPDQCEWAIRACLSANPAERPSSAKRFLDLLEDRPPRAKLWMRRYGRRAAIATIAGAALSGTIRLVVPRLLPRPARQPEAIASFKRGEEFVRRRNKEGITNAIQEFRAALDLEPNYAEAWAGLAESYAAGSNYGFLDAKKARIDAKQAAETALRLDDRLGKAHAVLAYLASIDLGRWRSAEPDFKHALSLDPNEPLTHAWYAAFLGRSGRFEEAVTHARRAVELDPASFYFNHQLAAEYLRAKRLEEYNQQAVALIRLQPYEPSGYLAAARGAEWLGQYDKALQYCAEAEKYGNAPTALVYRGTIEAARGNRAAAEKIAKEVEAYWKANPLESSVVINLFAQLGEFDKVVDILEQGYERGDGNVLAAPTTRYLEPMRDFPRYRVFLKKLGFDKPL
jgi:tetratricopeptide (TPR) repeat protein